MRARTRFGSLSISPIVSSPIPAPTSAARSITSRGGCVQSILSLHELANWEARVGALERKTPKPARRKAPARRTRRPQVTATPAHGPGPTITHSEEDPAADSRVPEHAAIVAEGAPAVLGSISTGREGRLRPASDEPQLAPRVRHTGRRGGRRPVSLRVLVSGARVTAPFGLSLPPVDALEQRERPEGRSRANGPAKAAARARPLYSPR